LAIHIPEDKLAEIRSTADIVDIISERVVLKKAGKDYVGLCPFHSEKTPSFTVSPGKQICHCFGCGAGGDVFSFLMKYDSIGFAEAVHSLSRRYGINLPSRKMTPEQKRIVTERQRLFDINIEIKEFYKQQLLDHSIGKIPLDYINKRGFSREMVDQFAIGFAPDSWDSLTRFFNRKNVPLSFAEKTGLIIAKKGGGFYDRFRNRIIFPIIDDSRQIIGFGGRVLDDSKPKYLNSPETVVYNKSKSLYGVHAAKDKCRETGFVYIVEGYFDLIALHQHGITNSVATLGTSLTGDHVRTLCRRYAKKVKLVFDSDLAGLKAAHRSISLFMNESVEAEIIILPEGYDPDSYLFEHGTESFYMISEKAISMMAFLVEYAIKTHGLSMEGKVRVIQDIIAPLNNISDNVARSIYIKYISERLNIDEAAVAEKMKLTEKHLHKQRQADSCSVLSTNQDVILTNEIIRFEKKILSMMLQSPDILPQIKERQVLEYFEDRRLMKIGQLVLTHLTSDGDSLAELMDRVDDTDDRRLIASLAISEESWNDEGRYKLLSQFITSRRRLQDDLLNQIKAAEESNNHKLLFKLLKEKQKQIIHR